VPEFGVFIVPNGEDPDLAVAAAVAADEAGLAYVGIQDHPYQRRYLDTWTLLSYIAARTQRVRLLPDVINLPLRLPAMLAKSVASLDRLSGGRVELGIGAGAFWDAVAAMGGPKRTPGESVEALEEAMQIIRSFLDMDSPSVRFKGDHYTVSGAKPGPAPAHRVGLWVGAYGPRMLRLTGRRGDGWLPSVGDPPYLPVEDIASRQEAIDAAARKAGRDPAGIVRAANVGLHESHEWLDGDRLRAFAEDHRFDVVLVSVPDDDALAFIRRLGAEVGGEGFASGARRRRYPG
jgi:alkanesulfonate monooxygenase SsuD/methylene tetrahydromethanopterin reductase-like flavin-dependent oxidoreductase (luciferase family)